MDTHHSKIDKPLFDCQKALQGEGEVCKIVVLPKSMMINLSWTNR
jgi:hypothetical protein